MVDMKNQFAEQLLEAYKNEFIIIEWGKQGYSLKFKDDFEFDQDNKKEFINFVFSIVGNVSRILQGKEIKETDNLKISVAEEIARCESVNSETVLLKSLSLLDTYRSIEYDILTHFDKKSDKTIKSAVLKISYDNEKETESINFDISKKEVSDLIETLNSLLEDLNMQSKIEG